MFSATDVASFLACQHISVLDRAEARKEIKKPFFDDPTVEMLQRLGNEHEQQHLRQLEEDGLSIAKICLGGSWESAVEETKKAIRSGADAIYQATFLDGEWQGRSDFLIRVILTVNLEIGRMRWSKLSWHAGPKLERSSSFVSIRIC